MPGPSSIPRYAFEPIGFARSPFSERAEAPRQATAASDVAGRIELLEGRGYEHALSGLEAFDRLWILFVFHKNVEQDRGWKPKVLPPRSDKKRGLFATRSPHRPNPIGMSAVAIERIEGLVIYVRGLDLLDGTPVLDLKPYVAYADAFPGARAGWLEVPDPIGGFEVVYEPLAAAQIDWLVEQGVALRASIEAVLSLGPEPHPYRRIRKHGDGMRLAIKEWRVDFVAEPEEPGAAKRVRVRAIASGYRAKALATEATGPSLAVHRAFVSQWG
jgi:tRNA-Thr(GGU) m(6)t(6)A37 methyltransferase TsaA